MPEYTNIFGFFCCAHPELCRLSIRPNYCVTSRIERRATFAIPSDGGRDGNDINTFTPAIVLLSVSVVIAPKFYYAHDYGYGFLKHCLLSNVINTLVTTAYSTRRKVQAPNESGQPYLKVWNLTAYPSPALGKNSMQTSKRNLTCSYLTRKRQACTFVRSRKAVQPNAPELPLYRYRSFRVVHCSTGSVAFYKI